MGSTSRKKRNSNFQKTINSLILKSSIVIFSFLVIIVLLSGLFIGTSLYGNYSKADSNADKSARIDFEQDNLSLLIVNIDDLEDEYSLINNIFLLNINLKDNSVGTFELPLTNVIEYSDNLGTGDLEKLYAITSAEKLDFENVLKNTIFKTYAINLDKYIIVDKKVIQELNGTLGYEKYTDLTGIIRLKNLSKIKQSLTVISENSRSNIVYVDTLKIINFFRTIDEKNLKVQKIIDKGEPFNSNWQRYLSITGPMQTEQLKIFIANASMNPKIPGLAGWGKNVVENIGGTVMNVDNSFIEIEQNTIITSSLEHVTYQQVAKQFGIDNVILKDDIQVTDGYNPEVYRSEVSVYLVDY